MSTALPPGVQAVLPLTAVQQGLLFHSLIATQPGVYLVQLVFDLHGPLDRQAFDAAWQALVARHASLRTAFAWQGLDKPLQVVGRQARLPLLWADWRGQPAGQHPVLTDQALASDRQQGMDLRRAPLARLQLLQLADQQHRVLFSHHHLLLDGWSLPLLLRDWQTAYARAAAQPPGTAAEASSLLPPADSSALGQHAQWLAQQDSAAAKAFWQGLLSGCSQSCVPAWVRPAPAVDHKLDAAAAPSGPIRLQTTLDATSSSALQALARRCRVTLGTLLQAAWALWLARNRGPAGDADSMAANTDVVWGLARAGRPAALPALAQAVGLFITTLPVRLPVPEAMPLADWLALLQARLLAQAPHEHLAPAEVQRCATGLAPGAALFDSVVVIENYPLGGDEGTGASRHAKHSNHHDAKLAALALGAADVHEATHYALSLYAVPGPQLALTLLADARRVAPGDATRALAQLQRLLQAWAASPAVAQQPLAHFGLAGPDDLATWHAADLAVLQPPPTVLLPEAIARRAADDPQALALVDSDGPLSRADLQALAAAIAQRLAAQGIGPGARVGISLPRGRQMLAALLAVWRLGAAYVPMDPAYPAARLQHMADDAGLATLLLQAGSRTALAWWTGPRCDLDEAVGAIGVDQLPAAPQALSADTPPDAPAYLIHTSGSTGQPKGVLISQRSLANLVAAMQRRLALPPAAPWLALTTLSFDIAALELFAPLAAGAALLLGADGALQQPQRLAAWIAEHQVQVVQATPSAWRLLLASGWMPGPGLTLLAGGEALDGALAAKLLAGGARLWNVYGPTETTVWSSALPVDAALLATLPEGATVPLGGMADGALDNTTLRVLDPHGRPQQVGVPGELCIGGLGLSPGYHRRPALSAERFVPDPLGHAGAGSVLYRTGDRVAWRADGRLDFLGRLDQQAKLRGHRIELGEIEAALASHPAVQQAAALIDVPARAAGDAGAEPRLLAFASLHAGQAGTAADLRLHLAQRLPAALRPAAIQLLASLPHTPNGKLDRRALQALAHSEARAAADAALAAPLQPGGSGLQQQLLQLWRTLLQQPGLQLHDHFFEAGGHSLLLLSLQNRLQRQLGHSVSLVDLFAHPTVASLAAHLSASPTAEQAADQAADQAAKPAGAAAQPADAGRAGQAGRSRLAQRRLATTTPLVDPSSTPCA